MISFERYFHNSRLEFYEKVSYKGMFLGNIPSSLKYKAFDFFNPNEFITKEKNGNIEIPFIIPMGVVNAPKKGRFVISKDHKSLTSNNKHYYFLEDDTVISKHFTSPETKNIIENNETFLILDQKFRFKCTNKKIILERVLD